MNREALWDFKALTERGLAKFAVVRASTFNKDLSNEKHFSQFHLVEQYTFNKALEARWEASGLVTIKQL